MPSNQIAPELMKAIRKKLMMVGDVYSGKKSLHRRITQGQFAEGYLPIRVEIENVDIEVDGKHLELELWWTSGNGDEEYDRLRPLSYPNTDVILLCFSIDSPESLEHIIEKWAPEVKLHCPNIPIILIGNKKDLRNDPSTISELEKVNQSPVTADEGQAMAELIGACAYLESSAKTNEGVSEVMETAAKAVIHLKTHRNQGSCKCI
ncbi:unnamed protein product, partial [Meganyctiphanes norvegica]